MKRLLFLVMVLMVVAPVAGLSLTFQDTSEFGAHIQCIKYSPGSASIGTCAWVQNKTGGNSYVSSTRVVYDALVVNADPLPMTYAAFTKPDTGGVNVVMYDGSLNQIGSFGLATSRPNSRIEIKVVGGSARAYINGASTSAPAVVLAQNPSYVGTYVGGVSYTDDFVYGTTENRYIFGSPEQGFFLKKDMINPATSGLFYANGTLLSSCNMTTTWGFGDSNASQTVQLKDYAGNVYWTYDTPAGSQAGSIAWPLQDAIFDSGAPYGFYVTTVAGSGKYSSVIPYIGSGAGVAFDRDTYARGDTAIVTYSVDAGYWDIVTYAYRLDTLDVYGNVVDSQVVTTQSGSKSVTFTSSDPLGIYYATLIATPTSGGSDVWLDFDSTELTGYLILTGNVFDAETEAYIPVANVSIKQGTIAYNKVTSADGNYTTNTMFYSGTLTEINVTAIGYYQYAYSFTPLDSKTITVNFTLQSLTPSHDGIAIGGVVRDTVYGRPISLPTVTATNATYAESYSVNGNGVGYYQIDESDSAFLTKDRCYTVTGSKIGYGSQNYLKCVV